MKRIGMATLLSLSAIAAAHAQSAGDWVVNAGWMHLAPLTTHSALGTVSSSTKVRINPIVTFVSVGYRF